MVRYRAWAIWPLGNLGVTLAVSRKLCVHSVIIMTLQKVGSFGEGKSFYESSFEEGEISSRILHPRKVATEGRQFGYPDAMVHNPMIFQRFQRWFPDFKRKHQPEIWKAIFRLVSFFSGIRDFFVVILFIFLSNQLFVEFFFHQPWVFFPRIFSVNPPVSVPNKNHKRQGGRLSRPATPKKNEGTKKSNKLDV